MNSIRRRTSTLFVSALSLSAVCFWSDISSAVGTRHFVIETAKDFKAGELEGVAVDSQGFLKAGWDLGAVEVSGADNIWAAMEHGGDLWLATGSEGKLIRVQAGKASEVAKADAMAITSIVRAFDKTIVGTMPGGKLYELKDDKLVEFSALKDGDHIWGLSYDAQAKALFAVTGPEGKLFRVTADGTAQVYFDAEQSHLVSVLAHEGKVYVGSSDEARLYEVTGPGRARVIYDFSTTEVRAIAAAEKGGLYVVVNELKGGARSGSTDKTSPNGPSKASPQSGSGSVYLIDAQGHPEKLYEDSSDHIVSLVVDAEGRPVLGTGGEGRVVRLMPHHQSVVLADVDERQVSRVIFSGDKGWVLSSDPVVAHPIMGVGGKSATWTSEVLDAGIRARFGQISWAASGKVELSTRTGNTQKPDETWSDWSAPLSKASQVTSADGRYLQVRARLLDGDKSEVRRIDVPFVTDNLRAVVTDVSAKALAITSGSTGVVESGSPLEGKASSKVKLSWTVDNPDEDSLRYRVEYRLEDSASWFDALDPGSVHTSSSYDWDTENLPEGKYRVRVTATDELSNPPLRVKRHHFQSQQILVDNTAPQLTKLALNGRTLVGTAVDGIGPIQRFELRIAGSPEWVPFEPQDGIFDESSEDFSLDLQEFTVAEKALITVRVFDTAGNFEVRHLEVPQTR